MKWYERTQQKLAELGWTGAELSRRAEIEIKTVYKYLDGKTENPRGNVLARIAKTLGVSEEWLRYGVDLPKETSSDIVKGDPKHLLPPIINETILAGLISTDIKYKDLPQGSQPMSFIKKDSYSDELVSIIIKDDNNAPDLQQGDMVVIDLKQEPTHGKFALGQIGDKSIIAMYTLAVRDRTPADALHFVKEGIRDIYVDDVDFDGLYRVVWIGKHH